MKADLKAEDLFLISVDFGHGKLHRKYIEKLDIDHCNIIYIFMETSKP